MNASPFCKNLNNANVEHLMGAGAPTIQSKPQNASGAATFCASTKVDVRDEVYREHWLRILMDLDDRVIKSLRTALG
jgi:hypothetical protein